MRTKTKIAIALFFTAFSLSKAFSFNPEPVLETNWTGWGKQYTDLFVDGYIWLEYHIYDVDFNSNTNTFSGKVSTTARIEGGTYVSVINISGNYNSTDFRIQMKYLSVYSQDVLPYELFWINNDVDVTLYTDSDDESYYLLQGHTKDQNGYNSFEIEFSNKPDYI